MSIADKLTTVAENVSKVFYSGYNCGERDGLNQGHNNGFKDGLIQGENAGISKGKREQNKYFWDIFQEKGNRNNYTNAFQYWVDEIFTPQHNIVCSSAYTPSVLRMSRLTDVKTMLNNCGVSIIFGGASMSNFAYGANTITHLPTLGNEKITGMSGAFSECTSLCSIDELILSNVDKCNCSTAFDKCSSLTDIKFSENCSPTNLNLQWSPLTHESLMSLINSLADKTGVSGTWSITLGASNIDKLTTDELLIMTNKGWNYL